MSDSNEYNKGKREILPSEKLKTGIDSIVCLFENKRNEYYKTISDNQIIINNLQRKIKKLVKENYILRKNNSHQNKLIEELKNENDDLKNIINNIKGKLNIDSNIILKNNINNNKIKINKIINNYGNNNNRTRNISNLSATSLNENFYLTSITDRNNRKNNVLINNLNREKELFHKKLEQNYSYNGFLNHNNDNYYNRLRTKNNSLNQSFFKRILNNSNDFYQNKKKIMKQKKSNDKRTVIKFNENNDKIKKKIIYNLSDSKNNIKKYENYKVSKNYNTIDINPDKIVFSNLVDRLWKAVSTQIITAILTALKNGQDAGFNTSFQDRGIHYKQKNWFTKDVDRFYTWDEIEMFSDNGTVFFINKQGTVLEQYTYLYTYNLHMLEAIMQIAKKKKLKRLSDLL
mgnify:CR=1 FL=1